MALGAQLPVRLDPDVDRRLAEAAKSAGTTKSAIIRMLAKSFVDQCVDDDGVVKLPPNWADLLSRADGRSDTASRSTAKTPQKPQLASSSSGHDSIVARDTKGSKREQYDAETKRLRDEDVRKRHEVLSALNLQAIAMNDQAISHAEALLVEACVQQGIPIPPQLRHLLLEGEDAAVSEPSSPAPPPVEPAAAVPKRRKKRSAQP